jgi:hypothetical protein
MDLTKLGELIRQEIERSEKEDGTFFMNKNIELKVLGQCSLLADNYVNRMIPLETTTDFDSHVNCSMLLDSVIRKVLLDHFGLELDGLSGEIWIPAESSWDEVFNESGIRILKIKPIYAILCKAIKAKAKNRVLVKEALAIYGSDLEDLIVKYGGNINDFR